MTDFVALIVHTAENRIAMSVFTFKQVDGQDAATGRVVDVIYRIAVDAVNRMKISEESGWKNT